MQSAVIAAFFHCCSSNQNPMHRQCPTGKDTWCKYKQELCDGKVYVDKTAGLSNSVIKVIKPTYLALCDKELLKKCLHGKTQREGVPPQKSKKITWSVAKSPRVAEQCDVNNQINKQIVMELQKRDIAISSMHTQFNRKMMRMQMSGTKRHRRNEWVKNARSRRALLMTTIKGRTEAQLKTFASNASEFFREIQGVTKLCGKTLRGDSSHQDKQ
ncbi:uncharacterized protein TNCV_1908961 [Trichonephila clavipes]|nr:uncharacterized protein TNCV_1908961 [Trichonephila clavipes]